MKVLFHLTGEYSLQNVSELKTKGINTVQEYCDTMSNFDKQNTKTPTTEVMA